MFLITILQTILYQIILTKHCMARPFTMLVEKTTNRQTSVFQPRVLPQIPHKGLCSIKCRCNPFNILQVSSISEQHLDKQTRGYIHKCI